MRFVTYSSDGASPRVGVLHDDEVRGLDPGPTLLDLLTEGEERLREAGRYAWTHPAEVRPVADVRLHAPIPRPPSIRDCLCFLDHKRGCQRALGRSDELPPVWSQVPAFYFANAGGVIGPYDDVPVPPGCRWLDFELEVGAVIGRPGRDLHPDEAEAHIVGYTLLCDWSARDLQQLDMQLGIGQAKGKDSAITLGPALVTADELEPYRRDGKPAMRLSASVNGTEITRGGLDAMDWSFGEVLAYASRGVDLVPGDVFGSGTVPGGCLLEHLDTADPDDFTRWLQPGDIVSLHGEGLGETSQRIVPGAEVHKLRSGF